MDALARATEMESLNQQYGLFVGQPDQFGDYPSVASHGHPGLPRDSGRNGASLPFANFMRDGPWDPLRANAPSKPGVFGPRHQGSYGYDNFSYREEPTALSDFGADSAYYSQSVVENLTRKSVVESTYGDPDRGTETQSFVQPFSDLHLHSQHSQGQDSVSVTGEKHWNPQHSPANPEPSYRVCPTCKASVKTKAELNKHKLRHEKPFRCDAPECPRTQGFGTQNDLARHQQSVHRAEGLKFRCAEGACKTKLKLWPRADNFKQHLKRVHGIIINAEGDLSGYEIRPSTNEDLAYLGTSVAQVDMPAQSERLSPWIGMDQSQESSGPPSGEIGYSHLGAVLEASQHQGPVDDQSPSDQLDEDDSQHQEQDSSDSDHLHTELHSTLSEFGSQSQAHEFMATGPTELYQESHALRTGVLNPADLVSPMRESHAVEAMAQGADDQYCQPEDKSQEKPQGDDLYVQDPGQSLTARLGREPAEQGRSHDGSELARLRDAVGSEAARGPEAAEALGDVRKLFHEPERAAGPNTKGTVAPCAVKEPMSSKAVSAKASLGDVALDVSDVSATLQKLMGELDKSELDKLVAKLGYRKAMEEEAKAQEGTPNPPAAPEREGAEVPCQESGCAKKFKRPCELKKHMKRHEKPYACTHADCDKRFGSKNDWKRHENSQHIQLEFWKCAEVLRDGSASPSVAPVVCNKICHRRETFKNHLDKDHGIADAKTIEERCTDCRNGRNFESRFWCGFCKKTIEFGKNGGLACSARFDHIDSHFTGKEGFDKMDIKDWKSIELEPAETFEEILPQNPRPAIQTSHATDSHSRKRRHDAGTSSSQSKRAKHCSSRKDSNQFLIWFCCNCNTNNFWQHAVTTTCLEAECGHHVCSRCSKE
ncbi:hypothetical protein B0T14DRAFT_280128 [Immersiella caudata]|uniref:C2H2-type domain-containing protein n=1 Tax=Immersiella caudata TaxID=314043 RepID=A0AA39WDN5_9PEZI|nr:hypothetical protein B0T14DRAFT_280128 [Immersiella caudata]